MSENQYTPPPPPPPYGFNPGKGMGTASLVLGIVSLVFCYISWVNIVGILTGIVGIVLAVSARKKSAEVGLPNGLATAGLVCSIIGLILSSLIFVVCTAACTAASLLYW